MIGSWCPSIPGHRVNQGRHRKSVPLCARDKVKERERETSCFILSQSPLPASSLKRVNNTRGVVACIKYAYPARKKERGWKGWKVGWLDPIQCRLWMMKGFRLFREFFQRFVYKIRKKWAKKLFSRLLSMNSRYNSLSFLRLD